MLGTLAQKLKQETFLAELYLQWLNLVESDHGKERCEGIRHSTC